MAIVVVVFRVIETLFGERISLAFKRTSLLTQTLLIKYLVLRSIATKPVEVTAKMTLLELQMPNLTAASNRKSNEMSESLKLT